MNKDHSLMHSNGDDDDGNIQENEAKRARASFLNEQLGGIIFLVILVLIGSTFLFFQARYLSNAHAGLRIEKEPAQWYYGDPEPESGEEGKQRVILRGYEVDDVAKLKSALQADWETMIVRYRRIRSMNHAKYVWEVKVDRVKDANGDGYVYHQTLRSGYESHDGHFQDDTDPSFNRVKTRNVSEVNGMIKEALRIFTDAVAVVTAGEEAARLNQLHDKRGGVRAYWLVEHTTGINQQCVMVKVVSADTVTYAINDLGEVAAWDLAKWFMASAKDVR